MKHCYHCGEDKPLGEFYKQKASSDGHQYTCKPCQRAKWADYRAGHKVEIAASQKRHNEGRSEEYKARVHAQAQVRWAAQKVSPEWRAKRAAEQHKYTWKHKYGLTGSEYDILFAARNGPCDICGELPKEGKFHSIDHDHAVKGYEKDALRGVLCENCNRGLGMFKDDPKRLAAAIEYLTEGRSRLLDRLAGS